MLVLLMAAVSGANAQIAVSGEGNTFTFTMPAYDVEITTELWYKLDASYIKGFRGYFQLHNRVSESGAQTRSFCINFGDGETTGIMPIRLENGSTIADGATYDLQGRKVQ